MPRDVVVVSDEGVRGEFASVFRPAPRLKLSEWADEHGYLAEPEGQRWDTSVVPYLREIMDAVTERSIREVVVMKPSRVGYTQGVLGQRIGYIIDQDPAPILVVQPTADDAKDWSQKELTKMLDASERLRGKVADKRSRDSGNTILNKLFSGGSITIRGAHSPKGLRRHTARDVVFDEADAFVVDSGEEGDPIMLGQRANRTYPDRKTVMGSTPKLKESSRIYRALMASDYREYHVACPHCDELQVLEWGGPEEEHGIKWLRRVTCRKCGAEVDGDACSCGGKAFDVEHLPETAHYVCRHCRGAIESHDKTDLLASGEWIPRFPGRKVRGYHITGLLSPFEGASWGEMVKEFLKSKDDRAMFQVWVNQWLGEPFEERGVKVDASSLEARAMVYVGEGGEIVEVPDGVGVLTAGVDVQGDRLELLVRGWGVERRSWDIFHERLYGDTHMQEVWGRLRFLLAREYIHAAGTRMRILATMVDSGDNTKGVYAFVRPLESANVWACKGDNGAAGNAPLTRPSRANADGVKLFTVGTYPLKSDLMARLQVSSPKLPSYVFLRQHDPDLCNGFDAEYFAQFGAERREVVRAKNTHRPEYRYVQKRKRNEAIDLHVYADAALHALGAAVRVNLATYAEAARSGKAPGRRGRRVRSKGVA